MVREVRRSLRSARSPPVETPRCSGGWFTVSAYRAVIFDFFGTLTRAVRRGPQHAEIARRLGCDPEIIRGVLDRTFHSRARGTFGSAEATIRWVSEQAGGRPRAAQVEAAVPARV